MRRVHVKEVTRGETALGEKESHHVRDVLRLEAGAPIEVFDDAGNVGRGTIRKSSRERVVVTISQLVPASDPGWNWAVASAIPKGTRGDWMIEKLCELGVAEFIPLVTSRGVVIPEGKNKRERWQRLAEEAARQSKRRGVMDIGEMQAVAALLSNIKAAGNPAWYLSTADDAQPITKVIETTAAIRPTPNHLTLLIGPEGGWTGDEISAFDAAGLTPVRMGTTILRVETAAVAAAAIVAGMLAPLLAGTSPENA